jgi:mannose-6-phosphate isomerase-like protein (cupin superfamily)
MSSIKTFAVFGDRVDVFVDSSMSNGLSSTLVQEVHPGGGPPPHSHTKEDETFVVIDGEFELLMDGQWHPLVSGEAAYARRGSIHTFRNSGTTIGRLMIVVTPGGFEKYLQEIGGYSPATDMPKIIEISNRYGITFYR